MSDIYMGIHTNHGTATLTKEEALAIAVVFINFPSDKAHITFNQFMDLAESRNMNIKMSDDLWGALMQAVRRSSAIHRESTSAPYPGLEGLEIKMTSISPPGYEPKPLETTSFFPGLPARPFESPERTQTPPSPEFIDFTPVVDKQAERKAYFTAQYGPGHWVSKRGFLHDNGSYTRVDPNGHTHSSRRPTFADRAFEAYGTVTRPFGKLLTGLDDKRDTRAAVKATGFSKEQVGNLFNGFMSFTMDPSGEYADWVYFAEKAGIPQEYIQEAAQEFGNNVLVTKESVARSVASVADRQRSASL